MTQSLLEQFEGVPFSEARRLFVVQQMLEGVDTDKYPQFSEHCRRLIDTDRQLLSHRVRQRHCPGPDTWEASQAGFDSPTELHSRAHEQFVALIEFVLATFPMCVARRLTAPALRQLHRLQSLSQRLVQTAPESGEDIRGARNSSSELGVRRRPALSS